MTDADLNHIVYRTKIGSDGYTIEIEYPTHRLDIMAPVHGIQAIHVILAFFSAAVQQPMVSVQIPEGTEVPVMAQLYATAGGAQGLRIGIPFVPRVRGSYTGLAASSAIRRVGVSFLSDLQRSLPGLVPLTPQAATPEA